MFDIGTPLEHVSKIFEAEKNVRKEEYFEKIGFYRHWRYGKRYGA